MEDHIWLERAIEAINLYTQILVLYNGKCDANGHMQC
jgi:hypothetical protein